MKKLLAILLSVCFCVVGAFTLTACNNTPPTDPPANPPSGPSAGEMTNAELSAAYKQVAVSTWESLGIDDPTTTTSPVLTTLPDKKVEIDMNTGEGLNIKLNANGMAGFLYMLGLLYENPAFTLTNGIVKFGATVTAGNGTTEQDYTLTSSIDTQTGKVELELIVDISAQGSNPAQSQYSFVEIDYNFTTNTLNSFRFAICNDMGMGTMFIDMALTTDEKFMWFNTTDATDSFAVAISADKDAFVTSAQAVTPLTTDFSTEVQSYFNVINSVMSKLGVGAPPQQ